MATEARTIYSYYDPEKDRERLEIETGQAPSGLGQTDADVASQWAQESASAFPRRLAPPPRFVPAKNAYTQPEAGPSKPIPLSGSDDVVSFYRSVTNLQTTASSSNEQPPGPSQFQRAPSTSPGTSNVPSERITKNNWFIANALKSADKLPLASSTSLADILARDPPPLPSEGKFHPPVFLSIGPSNRGFAMLERSGWNEGEPLGPDVARRKRASSFDGDAIPAPKRRGKQTLSIKQEVTSVNEGVWEVKNVETIDLTLSDSESESGSSDEETPHPDELPGMPPSHITSEMDPYGRKALVTPIATVLKADRLGIGLKAKTVGPYNESKKRVTHNAAALAAHIKTSQEQKQWRVQNGRGTKGYARKARKEAESRKAMLAYMNS